MKKYFLVIVAAIAFAGMALTGCKEKTIIKIEKPAEAPAAPAPEPDSSLSSDRPYHWLSERLCTSKDLAGKSQKELDIMRNYIYAMHNRKFKRHDLQRHFGQYSWYEPLYNDSQIRLSSIESKNVQFIKKHEY